MPHVPPPAPDASAAPAAPAASMAAQAASPTSSTAVPPAPAPPRVSIIMPSHNHGPYIGAAIAAIQAQTFADWELLIMDYASSDETWGVLNGPGVKGDARIIPVRFPEPGMGKALNEGFRRALGEYLCWHQTDNLPRPEWLQTMVDELDAHPEVDFLYSDFDHMDEEGRVLEEVRWGPFDPDMLLSYCLVGPTFLYRRAVYEAVGDYLESHPRDDHDYWVRVWLHGFGMKRIPKNLGANRLHAATRMRRMRQEYDDSLHDIIGPAIHAAQAALALAAAPPADRMGDLPGDQIDSATPTVPAAPAPHGPLGLRFKGEEVFRIRDRNPATLAAFEDGYARLRSRIRYFLDFFTHDRPGLKLAVHGLGPLEKLILDILDEFGAARGIELALLEDGSSLARRSFFGLPVFDMAGFAAWGGDHILLCRFDPGDAAARALQDAGAPREKIVHLFLPPREAL